VEGRGSGVAEGLDEMDCEEFGGVEGGGDGEVGVTGALEPGGKSLQGEIGCQKGWKLVELGCELDFDGEKGSVRRVSTDNCSDVDSMIWFIPFI
jgi:hypothetical protein